MSENFSGALIMTICMSAFVLNDAFVRLAGDSLPLAQILFIRGLITTAVLLSFAIYGGVFSLTISKKDKWRIFFRSIAEGFTAYFFLTAVMNMPFANVTAILQILPMTVTLAAAFFFKEKVGVFRSLLIIFGFLGVILIINPSADGFNLYAIYALIAVVLITTRDLITRKLSSEVPAILPTVSASIGVLLFSVILLINTPLQPLNSQNSLFMLAMVAIHLGAKTIAFTGVDPLNPVYFFENDFTLISHIISALASTDPWLGEWDGVNERIPLLHRSTAHRTLSMFPFIISGRSAVGDPERLLTMRRGLEFFLSLANYSSIDVGYFGTSSFMDELGIEKYG